MDGDDLKKLQRRFAKNSTNLSRSPNNIFSFLSSCRNAGGSLGKRETFPGFSQTFQGASENQFRHGENEKTGRNLGY